MVYDFISLIFQFFLNHKNSFHEIVTNVLEVVFMLGANVFNMMCIIVLVQY